MLQGYPVCIGRQYGNTKLADRKASFRLDAHRVSDSSSSTFIFNVLAQFAESA